MPLLARKRFPVIQRGLSPFSREYYSIINEIAEAAYDFAQLQYDLERKLAEIEDAKSDALETGFDAQLVNVNQVHPAFWVYTVEEVYIESLHPTFLYPIYAPVEGGLNGLAYNRLERAHITPPNDPEDPRYVWGVDIQDPALSATLIPLPVGGGGPDPTVTVTSPIIHVTTVNAPGAPNGLYVFEAMGSHYVQCSK